MYTAILLLAMSTTGDVSCYSQVSSHGCSARAGCSSPRAANCSSAVRVRVVAGCSAKVQGCSAKAHGCTSSAGNATLVQVQGRVGVVQRMHERKAERHAAASDRIAARRSTTMLLVAPSTPGNSVPKVPAKK